VPISQLSFELSHGALSFRGFSPRKESWHEDGTSNFSGNHRFAFCGRRVKHFAGCDRVSERNGFRYDSLFRSGGRSGLLTSVHQARPDRKISSRVESGKVAFALSPGLAGGIASLQKEGGLALTGSAINTKEVIPVASLSLILKGVFKNGQVVRVTSGGRPVTTFGVFAHHFNTIHVGLTDRMDRVKLAPGSLHVEVTVDGKPLSAGEVALVLG
jgi:hypothetical protein